MKALHKGDGFHRMFTGEMWPFDSLKSLPDIPKILERSSKDLQKGLHKQTALHAADYPKFGFQTPYPNKLWNRFSGVLDCRLKSI